MVVAILAPAVAQAQISVRSAPDRPFAEVTAGGIAVNGDLVVRNAGAGAYELVELHLDVRDRDGALAQRRELNGNGTSPSIRTIPERRVEKDGALLIYNPFSTFASDVAVGRLDYRLVFKPAEGAPVSVSLSVTPRAPPDQAFRLPLQGRVMVWDGHELYSHHRRWNYLLPPLVRAGYTGNAGRYAYDFIVVDEGGRRSTGDEADNRNWLAFGQPVTAPAAGEVVAVNGAAADDRTFRYDRKDANSIFGNYVVLRHADSTFSLLGHLMQGSPTVRVGERVRAGDVVGRIGASGDSLFPHLHYQRADGPTDLAEGVPVTWRGLRRAVGRRTQALSNGYLDSGDIVVSR